MPNEQEHLDEAIRHARDYFAQCVEDYGREAYLRGDDMDGDDMDGDDRRRFLAAVLAEHTRVS